MVWAVMIPLCVTYAEYQRQGSMNNQSMMDRVRGIVRDTFIVLGEKYGSVIQESVLIRDGIYCGHRFRGEKAQAVWFIEEDELKFYGRDGLVCQTLHPSHAVDTPALRVA